MQYIFYDTDKKDEKSTNISVYQCAIMTKSPQMTQIKKIKINKYQCLSVCYNDEKPTDDTDKKDKKSTNISVYQCAIMTKSPQMTQIKKIKNQQISVFISVL
jgi:hypothetical protein